MKCKIPDRDLILYAEGSLSAEAKDHLNSHLAECSECRDFLSFLEKSMMIVQKDKEISTNPFLFTRIMTRMEGNEKRELTYTKKYVPAFVFSFILLAAILGGIFMGKLYSGNSSGYTNDLQEEVSYFNDIRQESIETFFLTIDDDENE